MGTQCDHTSVIYRFQKGLQPSQERSTVQYSHWIWYTYQTS